MTAVCFRLKRVHLVALSVWPNTTRFSGKSRAQTEGFQLNFVQVLQAMFAQVWLVLYGFSIFNFCLCYFRIEEELGDAALFAGKKFRNPLEK